MEPEVLEPEDDAVPTVGMSRKTLLIGLLALGGVAVFLAVIRVAMERRVNPPADTGIVPGDWTASLQHLADAFQARTDGLDERLAALEPKPEPTNYAVPLPPLTDGPANQTAPALSEEPPPPSPAAVSL